MSVALTTGLALAKFVPEVVGWFAGDKAESAASSIVGIAEKVTGLGGDEALKAIESDPNTALEFKKAVMANKYELDRIYLANTAGARDMYTESRTLADRVALGIMRYNFFFVVILLVCNAVACWYLKDHPAVLSGIATTIGFVINAFIKERSDVSNFLFGSTLGSRMKDVKK